MVSVSAGTPVKFLPEHNHAVNSNSTSPFHTKTMMLMMMMMMVSNKMPQ